MWPLEHAIRQGWKLHPGRGTARDRTSEPRTPPAQPAKPYFLSGPQIITASPKPRIGERLIFSFGHATVLHDRAELLTADDEFVTDALVGEVILETPGYYKLRVWLPNTTTYADSKIIYIAPEPTPFVPQPTVDNTPINSERPGVEVVGFAGWLAELDGRLTALEERYAL